MLLENLVAVPIISFPILKALCQIIYFYKLNTGSLVLSQDAHFLQQAHILSVKYKNIPQGMQDKGEWEAV